MALKITIGDEYKIKIEQEDDFKKSIFSELYKAASRNIEAIISQSIITEKKSFGKSSISDDSYNNIIAFTGERGTGKSSSMISFAEGLIKKDRNSTFFLEKDYPNIFKKSIVSIDVIDPSLFRGEDQLFEIIISKMFARFQKKLKNEREEINHDHKRKLIERFQHVFNNLKVVHKGKKEVYEKEAIEALSDLAYGSNLKLSFKKLVDEYLNYVGNQSEFLLVAIDDFDLNISGAYEMLEDIRQFLVQSNIIILVACKIEQLQDSINNEIINEYQSVLGSNSSKHERLSENVNDKSSRYLEKMFPLEHRISTPKLIDNNIQEKYYSIYDVNFEKRGSSNDDKHFFLVDKPLEDTFLELVYKKSDFFLSKTDSLKNSVIPNTIRDFTSTVTYIYRGNSLQSFKNYLLKEVGNSLSKDFKSLFDELEDTPTKFINQFIVNWFFLENDRRRRENQIHNDNFRSREEDYRLLFFDDFSSRKNRSKSDSIGQLVRASKHYNVSFGDIVYLFRELDDYKLISDNQLSKFYNYLRVYYSIRVSESIGAEGNFHDLINGRLTNTSVKFLPKEKSGINRDEFKIDRKPLDIFEETKRVIPEEEKAVEVYYWLTFFFTQLGSLPENFRRIDQVFHERSNKGKVGNPLQSVNFNSIAFIYNILSPDIVFDRFMPIEIEKSTVKFYNELSEWNYGLSEYSNYFGIFNIDLFNEFLKLLQKKASEKDSFSSYAERLNTYLLKGIDDVLNILFEKYPHLILEEVTDNPFFKFWKENSESINNVLNFIKEEVLVDENIDKLNLLINNYRYNIEDANENSKSRTITNLMKKINEISIPRNERLEEIYEYLVYFKDNLRVESFYENNKDVLFEKLLEFKYVD